MHLRLPTVRALALILCALLLLPLASCGKKTEDGAASSSGAAQPTELPRASTLAGSVHVPPIGNQGSIGCCTSMAVTYMQFTIAVSQYLHSIDPDTEWNPSSGNPAFIFSPKFSYNLSGAGTAFAYDVLKDEGCLTIEDTFFETDKDGTPTKEKNTRMSTKTTSWDVDEGQLQKALDYRLLNYEEVENTSMQVGGGDSPLLTKIKSAVAEGNGVVFSCWSSNWRDAPIDRKQTGTLGKKGDMAIYTAIDNTKYTDSADDASGNHCVCIVGYDDDIKLTVGGVTLQGAFQIANSWGDGWGNDGYAWMMYDAFNTKSTFDILNDPEFLSTTKHITPTVNGARFSTAAQGDEGQFLTFNKGESFVELEGKTYPLFTITSEGNGALTVGEDGAVTFADGAGTNFAVIPYVDAAPWIDEDPKDATYKDSYLLYDADVNAGKDGEGFLGTTKGAGMGLVAFGKASGRKNCCLEIPRYRTTGNATCRVSRVSDKGNPAERTAAGYRFSFIYWDKDIAVGGPGASVEVILDDKRREGVSLTIGRIDAAGDRVERTPAMFRYNIDGTNHVYSDLAPSFAFYGQRSGDATLQRAFFTIGCNEMAELMEGYGTDSFLWTVSVSGAGAKVASIRMKDRDGKVLFDVALPEDTPELAAGQSLSFIIDLGGELKEYSAEPEGTRRIQNAGSGNYLTRQKMLVGTQKDPSDEGKFDISLDSKAGYFFYASGDKVLLDITGKEISSGVEVKFNGRFESRATQTFDLLRQQDGSFQIALHTDPTFLLAETPEGKVALAPAKDAGSEALWRFSSAGEESGTPGSVRVDGGKLAFSSSLPEDAESEGAFTLTMTDAAGATVASSEITGTAAGGSYTVTFDAPPSGNYLLTIRTADGTAVGDRYAVAVK